MGIIATNLSVSNITTSNTPGPGLAMEAVLRTGVNTMPGSQTSTTTLTNFDIFWMINRSNGGSFMWPKATGSCLTTYNASLEFFNSVTFNTNNVTFTGAWDSNPNNYVEYYLRKTTGVFDTVSWTGDGTGTRLINHSLGVVPEYVIIRARNNMSENWQVYCKNGAGGVRMYWNTLDGQLLSTGSLPSATSTQFNPCEVNNAHQGTNSGNLNGINYIALLFATAAGASYVGTYTGNGTTQTINCGFTNGARFVMIKATSSPTSWYIFDSTRGIGAGNELHNINTSGTAEQSNDILSFASSGFGVNSVSAVNNLGTTYTVLALSN